MYTFTIALVFLWLSRSVIYTSSHVFIAAIERGPYALYNYQLFIEIVLGSIIIILLLFCVSKHAEWDAAPMIARMSLSSPLISLLLDRFDSWTLYYIQYRSALFYSGICSGVCPAQCFCFFFFASVIRERTRGSIITFGGVQTKVRLSPPPPRVEQLKQKHPRKVWKKRPLIISATCLVHSQPVRSVTCSALGIIL